jgi:hypothetical protein
MNAILKFNLLLIACCFLSGNIKSQDIIVKTNGDSIRAKITEIGTNAISYKKFNDQNGPTFVENKSNILLIKLASGEIQKFTPSVANTSTISVMTNTAASTNSTTSTGTTTASNDGKNKIERDGSKYLVNGKKVKRKTVNELLGESKNPMIIAPLKATKMMGGAQKIVKLTSIPSTIGGGFTFLWKGIDMWNDIQRGRATTQSYVNAALSLVGTLTLPITNKILKKKSNKMYDKLIGIYNVTN